MTQHFLLSAASKTLKLKDIYQGGEDAAYAKFCALLAGRKPLASLNARAAAVWDAYKIASRRKFECKACKHHFSVTSGTIFASRKLSFMDMLAAICILANAAKGVSSVQLSRDLGVQYRTAYVLAHKVREAMARETQDATLGNECEIDGAYFGGHVRPHNIAAKRVDRRLKENQSPRRRVVIALRERMGRTLTTVTHREAEGVQFAMDRLDSAARLNADEAAHWDALEAIFPVKRINHSEAYSANGVCTNQVESYFSRLRRMVGGQHHHVSAQYLHQYAAHAAWLDDHCRESNGTLANRIVRNAMASPVSRQWKGYWQRHQAA